MVYFLMPRRLSSVRFGIAAAVVLTAISGSPHVGADTGSAPQKLTRAQEAAWHLEQGKKLWEDNKIDEAVTQWKETLKIDPANQEAIDMLAQAGVSVSPPTASTASEDPAKLRAERVAGAKDALTRYAKVRGLTALCDVLEDKTADEFARRALVALSDAIQDYESGPDAWDPSLHDDYQQFIASSGLSGLLQARDAAKYSTDRLHGRALLKALLPWVDRAAKSHVILLFDYPDAMASAADSLDKDTFTDTDDRALILDGPSLENGPPLEAREEDGVWRIGPLRGQVMGFNIRVDVTKRLLRRV